VTESPVRSARSDEVAFKRSFSEIQLGLPLPRARIRARRVLGDGERGLWVARAAPAVGMPRSKSLHWAVTQDPREDAWRCQKPVGKLIRIARGWLQENPSLMNCLLPLSVKSRPVFVLVTAFTCPAYAETTAKDIYVSGVIGAVSVGGLLLLILAYRLSKVLISKARSSYSEYRQSAKREGHQHRGGLSLDASMRVSLGHPSNDSRETGHALPVSNKAQAIDPSPGQGPFNPLKHKADRSVAISSDNGKPKSSPSDDCWSEALVEFEGSARRLGVWAKAFAEAHGNEAVAKAEYLRIRSQELHLIVVRREEAQRAQNLAEHEAVAFEKLLNVQATDFQTSNACEAHLRALGFEVHKPRPDRWEITGAGFGTSFIYSVADLQKQAQDLTRRLRESRPRASELHEAAVVRHRPESEQRKKQQVDAAFEYLGKPISGAEYVSKYKVTPQEVLDAVGLKKIKAHWVEDVLWIEDRPI
jgi:hypothetical protein